MVQTLTYTTPELRDLLSMTTPTSITGALGAMCSLGQGKQAYRLFRLGALGFAYVCISLLPYHIRIRAKQGFYNLTLVYSTRYVLV